MQSRDAASVCEHGQTSDWWWGLLAGGAWAGPLSTCSCCGAEFGYIDSMSIGPNGTHGQSWTKDLCSRCGGHFVHF